MSNSDLASRLGHKTGEPVSIGCMRCPDLNLCGGLRTAESRFDCLIFCECPDRSKCNLACPNNPEIFIERTREVLGFDLSNTPRGPVLEYPTLAKCIPMIYHSSRRAKPLDHEAVAIPLSYILNRKTGRLRFENREELADNFGIGVDSKLVIVGVDQDQPIEDYWGLRRVAKIPEHLAMLKPDLITSPNYSLALDVVRHENLHNMKRIAICWSEFVLAGIPTSLHLNGLTERDWERWTEFVAERDEIKSVSFEFATGPARAEWGNWYVKRLVDLASKIDRDLQLVVRGGYAYLHKLKRAFKDVVFIDTTSFVKTMMRQKIVLKGGKHDWISGRTAPNVMLDKLLVHNVKHYGEVVANRIEVSR